MANFFKRVKDGIVNSATKILNKATHRAIPEIVDRISEESLEIWKSTPTYQSLVNAGGLNESKNLFHQFGFLPGEAITLVDGFLEEASKNIRVEFREFKPGTKTIFGGGIQIFVLKESLGDALSSSFSSFTTEKGFQIEWAKWLLTEGNKVIISDFKFKDGSPQYSRSGDGIMIKANNGVFRVPTEHQGISGDNFLTRSLKASLNEIAAKYSVIIKSAIVRSL
jgi:hypothetical protein